MGVKQAKVQSFVTYLKLHFCIVYYCSVSNFDMSNIVPLIPEGKGLNTIPIGSNFNTLGICWSESAATVTAGEIKNPEKMLRRVLSME